MANNPRWYVWAPAESELYLFRDDRYILTHSRRSGLRVAYAGSSSKIAKERKAFFIPEELML